MIYTKHFKVVLVANESEITTECQNKLLHIMNDFLFHHTFIQVSNIPYPKFFYILKVKHIFIFKGINSPESQF